MFAAQSAILVSAAALALITITTDPPVPLIFVFAGLLAGGASVDSVARSAIVPALAGDRLRGGAEPASTACTRPSAVVGPAVGGLMIARARRRRGLRRAGRPGSS